MPKGKKEDKPILDEKFQQFEINAKDPKTVVLMLDSPEQTIVCKACQALQKHMEKSEQNCLEAHGLGVTQRLVQLLSSTDKTICACSILCLAVMIPNMSVRRSLLQVNCVSPLLKMLKPDEELVILEKASFIVSQLAEEFTFKQRLQEEGVCSYLLQLVSHGDCDVIKNSIKGLSLLTNHHSSRTSVAEANGFPQLLSLLDSEYAEIQELVLHTLEHCLRDGQCRVAFKDAEGLKKITEFLNNKEWGDLHVLAVDVLSLCLVEEGGMEALHSSDCLQRLLESIHNSQLPQMKTKAALALARSSQDPVSQKILHEQNAEKVFLDLLTSQDEAVLTASCEVLTSLSALASSRQRVGREGGIATLVQLSQHATPAVRSAAVQTLSAVIWEAQANANLVSEAGGSESLVDLLSEKEASCCVYAASCIISMAPNCSLRSELVEQGAITGLVDCISHTDARVVSTSVEAIALLATDSVAREQFPIEKIDVLLSLVLSSHVQISRCATWALSVLVQNKRITDAVFRKKGLETLEKLSKETNHREIYEYSQLAIKRLLAGSPAAKYYITGSLSPQDTLIGIEFWDMGMAEAKGGFTPLEDIMSQTPSLNRPVLTVSLINQPLPSPPPIIGNEEGVAGREESLLEVSVGQSKSNRQTQAQTTTKNKKGKGDKSNEVLITDLGEESEQPHLTDWLLPPDEGLWEHITYVQTHIQPLTSVQEQAERLAIYVSQVMGGAVGRSTNFQFELPLAKTQITNHSPLVPLGTIRKGTFQHRSLLYKVLSDHLGLPCSLYRGQYGRYWNTVLLNRGEWLVDIMYIPGKLLELDEQDAANYKSI